MVQRQHSALTLWPTKTVLSSPQETSKPPSPSALRPKAHLVNCATKSYEHTGTSKGSRKERNKQEREDNPWWYLLPKYKNIRIEWTPDRGNLRLISNAYQPEPGSERMDLHTWVMPGDEAVPNGRIERWMEATLMRGRWRACQSGISDGCKDWRNRGGFLYSDRRSTRGGEQ